VLEGRGIARIGGEQQGVAIDTLDRESCTNATRYFNFSPGKTPTDLEDACRDRKCHKD